MGDSHRTCEICHIQERYSTEKLFFARFPLDENRCKQWVKVVGKEDLVHVPIEKLHGLRHVCEKHFQKRDFTKTKTRLKKRAVPKLNLTATPLTDDQLSEFPLHIAMDTNEPMVRTTPTQPSSSVCQATITSKSQVKPAPSTSGQIQPPHSEHCKLDLPILTHKPEILVTATSQLEHVPSTSTGQIQPPLSECCKSDLPILTHQPEILVTATSQLEHVPSTSTGQIQLPLSEYCKSVPALITPAFEQGHASNTQTQCTAPIASGSVQNDIEPLSNTTKQKVCSKGVKRKLDTEIGIDVTPRKKKLMAQLKKTKCTIASLKKSAKLIESISSPVLKDLVISAIKNQKRKPQGKRWTTKNKISALAIFKRSPRAYRYLQHVLPLPSTKTLQKILKQIPMEPGINQAVINLLNKKASTTSDLDKYCVITFDEMALKQRLIYNEATDKVEGFVDFGGKNGRNEHHADHCLVFQLQGIRKKIKQPLAFYFTKGTVSSEKLAVLIKEIIDSVTSTGYRVIGTVCDQGPTNVGALTLLRKWHNGGDNYFVHNTEKIYNIYDVPHLIKSIRNNFMKYGNISMENKIGKWSHILKVEEQNRNFLYMSKISPTHVMPKYRAKMKVKYAAQILSQTVAAVLKLLSKSRENESISEEMLQTASIVEDFNRLFDFTNGPSNPDDVKKGIRENVSSKTDHLTVWAEFRQKLETITFVDNYGKQARNVKCINGYITTLKSLRDIWMFMKDKGYKYLNLRQLNQDALENLFGLIRQHSPTNRHPTCSSLMAALKTSVISGMTAPHSRGANCEKDYQNLLTDFHDLVFPEKQGSEETEIVIPRDDSRVEESIDMPMLPSPPTLSLPDEFLEYLEIESDLSSTKEQPLVYVSGYIASVMLKKYNNCDSCKNSLSVSEPKDNPIYELIKLKEWWRDNICLTYPSITLCRTVETARNIFEKEIIPMFYQENLCQLTVTIFHLHCDVSWVCTDHCSHLVDDMFRRISLLFIRRQCQKVNSQLAVKEEELSDANKRGEQYGVVK